MNSPDHSSSTPFARLSALAFVPSQTFEIENRDITIIDADESILNKTLQRLVDALAR